jgi:N-acetylmuramoyl-L-alanine amidase
LRPRAVRPHAARETLLAALAAVAVAVSAQGASQPETIVVLTDSGQRREVLPIARGGSVLVPLDHVVSGLGVGLTIDGSRGTATLSFQGREVRVFHNKSLASVPVDAVPRLLIPLFGVPVEWRPGSRALLLGSVRIPRISLASSVTGGAVRLTLEASSDVVFRVSKQEGQINIAIAADAVDVTFDRERLTGGVVDGVQYLGGREHLVTVTLGRRFESFQATEQEAPRRLILDFQATPLAARPQAAPPSPSRAAPQPERTVRTVVIDPGHGGAEVGAQGPGGALEKDVTLGVARRLRAILSGSYGIQAFLTRERDQDLALDERTAIANNFKADLFVSIHVNASRSQVANGSEVYFLSYQASDDESRRVAQIEGAHVVPESPSADGSDLAMILWDMAQALHLEDSSTLATRMQEELAVVTGSQGRGVKQAPFRVLVGAAMPAVLVELAFISHPEEEKLLVSDAYQSKLAAALARGISRFEAERAVRRGFRPSP